MKLNSGGEVALVFSGDLLALDRGARDLLRSVFDLQDRFEAGEMLPTSQAQTVATALMNAQTAPTAFSTACTATAVDFDFEETV